MLRGVFSVVSALSSKVRSITYIKSPSISNGAFSFNIKSLLSDQNANFTSLAPGISSPTATSRGATECTKKILQSHGVTFEQIRTVTKFSLKKGKRKSVKAVRNRFFRLHWGIWIRTMSGRHNKLWNKSASRRNRLLGHVFCNAQQCRLLDKMVTKYWRKPKYYIDDPYSPYHEREEFLITRRKPWRPEGVDYE